MISIARIFGAPESVPGRERPRSASSASLPSRSSPTTELTMCMTWL